MLTNFGIVQVRLYDYPQSNGKAENAVKIAKRIMEKAFAVGADPYLGFLDFRNTSTEGLATSPVTESIWPPNKNRPTHVQ